MTHQVITDQVNIDQCPTPDFTLKGNQLTIGDLHGNALKLLYSLVRHGVATIEADKYTRFVEIYRKQTSSLTSQDLNEIRSIIDNLEINHKPLLRMLGDELADRGQNDYFTLLLLSKLHNHSVPFEILLSNHGYMFVQAFEKLKINKQFNKSTHPAATYEHAKSIHNMQQLINDGKLLPEEIEKLVNDAYLPASKLISYSTDTSGQMTVYSHAPIDEELLQHLAIRMQINYQDETPDELARTIDAINDAYQEKYVKTKMVHTLPLDIDSYRKSDPITYLMWNRELNELKRNHGHRNYKLCFVHGHHTVPKEENVYGLNNTLGILLHMHSGQYRVLLSNELTPDLKLTEGSINSSSVIENLNTSLNTVPKINSAPRLIRRMTSEEQAYSAQLKFMKSKTATLRKKSQNDVNYLVAVNTADLLCTSLDDAMKTYLESDSNKMTYTQFYNTSMNAINDARTILREHRGWRQVIENVCAAIVGFGVIYGIASLINYAITGNFLFFFSETDSAKKLNTVTEHLSAIPIPS